MDALDEMRALLKSAGYTVRGKYPREEWISPITRRAVLIMNLDKGTIRLCAQNIGMYADRIPKSLERAIEHAPNCGGGCKPWGGKACEGGWSFTLNGQELKKCRYGSFMFKIVDTYLNDLRDMLKMELESRI